MSNAQLPVVCFAPPLTEELLARYTTLIEAEPASETKDALQQLLRCAKAWWLLPESTRTDGAPFKLLHRGADVTCKIVPLEPEQVTALWDVTPWMRELNSLSPEKGADAGVGLLDEVQINEVNRNAAKMQTWQANVSEAILKAKLTGTQFEFFDSPKYTVLQEMLEALNQLEVDEAELAGMQDAVTAIFAMPRAEYEDFSVRVTDGYTTIQAVLRGTAEGPIARPTLESTELRDAAFHLLWHVKEITLDREPMTLDKLEAASA